MGLSTRKSGERGPFIESGAVLVGWVMKMVRWVAGWAEARLEVGGGADAEAGGFLVEEAGRGQILRGQAE